MGLPVNEAKDFGRASESVFIKSRACSSQTTSLRMAESMWTRLHSHQIWCCDENTAFPIHFQGDPLQQPLTHPTTTFAVDLSGTWGWVWLIFWLPQSASRCDCWSWSDLIQTQHICHTEGPVMLSTWHTPSLHRTTYNPAGFQRSFRFGVKSARVMCSVLCSSAVHQNSGDICTRHTLFSGLD